MMYKTATTSATAITLVVTLRPNIDKTPYTLAKKRTKKKSHLFPDTVPPSRQMRLMVITLKYKLYHNLEARGKGESHSCGKIAARKVLVKRVRE